MALRTAGRTPAPPRPVGHGTSSSALSSASEWNCSRRRAPVAVQWTLWRPRPASGRVVHREWRRVEALCRGARSRPFLRAGQLNSAIAAASHASRVADSRVVRPWRMQKPWRARISSSALGLSRAVLREREGSADVPPDEVPAADVAADASHSICHSKKIGKKRKIGLRLSIKLN